MGFTLCQFKPLLKSFLYNLLTKSEATDWFFCSKELLCQPKEQQSSEAGLDQQKHSQTAQKHSHVQSAFLSKLWLRLLSYRHPGHSHYMIQVLKINWEAYLRSLTVTRTNFIFATKQLCRTLQTLNLTYTSPQICIYHTDIPTFNTPWNTWYAGNLSTKEAIALFPWIHKQIKNILFQGSQNKTAFKLLITSIRQQKRFNYCQLKWPWENLQDSGSSLGLDFISMNKRH